MENQMSHILEQHKSNLWKPATLSILGYKKEEFQMLIGQCRIK